MRRQAFLDAHRRLGLTVYPGLFESLTTDEQTAIVTLAEAGRRHAKTDLDRLDAAIRTLIDVRYDDDLVRGRARKALDALLNIKDSLGDPADPDAADELSDDPADEDAAKADSAKADKTAKTAAAKTTTAKPSGDKAAAGDKAGGKAASGLAGDRGVTVNIAASDDDIDEFVGTISEVTDEDVTLDLDEAADFDSVTVSHDLVVDWAPVGGEAVLAEHPGHANQSVHGKRMTVGTKGKMRARRPPKLSKTAGQPYDKRNALPTDAKALKNMNRRLIYRSNKGSQGDRLRDSQSRFPPVVRTGAGRPMPASADYGLDGTQGVSMLSEAAEGSTWDVLLIQPGTSKNRRRYRREVLQEAVERGAFEGARAFAPDGPDHFGYGAYGRKRGTKELVGWWTDIRYSESVTLPNGKVTEGVTGTFHVSEAAPWLRTMLHDAWQRQKPDLVGWSIVADGPTKVVRGEDGRPLADVGRLDVVESIDPVVNPAAGGATVRLVASQEGNVNWQTLTLAEAVRGLAAGTILPDELREQRPDLARAVESFDGNAGSAAADAKALVEAEMAKFRLVQALEARLAQRPRLAEAVKVRIRERVTEGIAEGTILGETDIDTAIKDEVEYVAAFAPAGLGTSTTTVVESAKDERDRLIEAAYDGLSGKDKDFSIAQFYVDLTGDRQFSGKVQDGGRLSESLTSTSFGEIMGDSITRRMLDYYNLPGLDAWRSIVTIDNVRDFRTYRRTRFGGYGNLPTVAQGAAYTALSSPTDEEATFAVTKRGGTEDMTLETIANDDLGALREIPRRLGRAAAQTLHEFVFDFLAGNGAIYDSVALAHATHNNTGTTALGAAPLTAGRTAMLKQTDMSNSKRLGIRPAFLIVPIDLEQTAYELTATDREVASANNTLNFVRTFGLSVIRVDYWTDANNWWLVASPNEVPTINLGFLNGNEQPELFVQDQPTVGNVFSNDKITYKIRHIYGGAVMDFRGFYGAIVA